MSQIQINTVIYTATLKRIREGRRGEGKGKGSGGKGRGGGRKGGRGEMPSEKM